METINDRNITDQAMRELDECVGPALRIFLDALACNVPADIAMMRALKSALRSSSPQSGAQAGGEPVQIGLNEDGTLDEVIGRGQFHLEQMDDGHWWMLLGNTHVWLYSKKKITATYEQEREPALPQTQRGEG